MYINIFDGWLMNFVIESFIFLRSLIIIDSWLLLFIDRSIPKYLIKIISGIDIDVLIIKIILLNLNFSFDAILVMYINKTNIPPTIIRNVMYEYQNLGFINPEDMVINNVSASRINPIDMGWESIMNIILNIDIDLKIKIVIQRIV